MPPTANPGARSTALAAPEVLVVEDDPLGRELVTELLHAAGWTVRQAESGEDGLARARERVPALVLMDLGLPGIDGLTAMRSLRGDARTAEVAIVALTAQAMAGDAERAIAAGFDDYLTKPLNTRNLIPRLEAVMARRVTMREDTT